MKQDPTHAADTVLQALYAAVGDDQAWQQAVRILGEAAGATIAMLVVRGQNQRQQAFYAAWNHPESAAEAYSRYWWRLDPFIRVAAERDLFHTGTVVRGSDLVAGARLSRLAFYHRFMLTMPARHLLTGVVADGSDPDGPPPVHLSLFRPPHAADFDVADEHWLRALMPHLRRAFDLHWTHRRHAEQVALYQATLAGLDFGVLLIDPAQRVHFVNPAAARMLADGHHRALSGLPDHVPRSGAVAQLLGDAAHGQRRVQPLGDGERRLLAMSAPLSPAAAASASSDVMLLLVEQDAAPALLFGFLAQGFGLTAAESRLLPAIYAGRPAADIAQSMGLKTSTVRSQLASIFARTGCHRQQDLIRLLGALPPIRDD